MKRHAFLALTASIVLIAAIINSNFIQSTPPGAEAMQNRERAIQATGTPVAESVEDNDPLDGDPLDGAPRATASDEPGDFAQLEIVRSGRPSDSPKSLAAYDDDPQTAWTYNGDAEDAFLWLDLGEVQRLREVRWLASGSGRIETSLSVDRQRWQAVDDRVVRPGWQTIEPRDDARYVRLTLTAADEGELPAIAEVAAFGPARDGDVSLQQKAKDKKDKKNKKRERTRDDTAIPKDEKDPKPARDNNQGGTRAESRPGVSAEPGETNCRGKRARCEAQPGNVSVEEDCQTEGTCVIDIVADGGTASCDASATDENAAGRGEGKRGADGGRCEATANGGAVVIGDINP